MDNYNIYSDIEKRTGGDIYIGVVGPVRTGKSTFIKNFMDLIVLPNIADTNIKTRAVDELPQSAAGKTIMTTEPKFVPNEAVNITLGENVNLKVRLIDCVGYIVENALGYIEDGGARMVNTPWSDKPMPFETAAELGTKKVITDHSTIGILVTTDGSIGELGRAEYVNAERRVADELNSIHKPFVVIVNTKNPASEETQRLCRSLEEEYGTSTAALDVANMGVADINNILEKLLFEFPVREVNFSMPSWIDALEDSHWLKNAIYHSILEAGRGIAKIGELTQIPKKTEENEYVTSAKLVNADLGKGVGYVDIDVPHELFYKIIGEQTGLEITDDASLVSMISSLAQAKKKYDKVADALNQVEATGYGIVTPTLEDLTLEEPEIIRQGTRYGVRLKASAPSIHMIKADIQTEVSPIVGSEVQSQDLVEYILADYEDNPEKIWESNIFGKTLNELVNEGLSSKLNKMPQEARDKLQSTLERIVNEGSGGLICIIL